MIRQDDYLNRWMVKEYTRPQDVDRVRVLMLQGVQGCKILGM